MTMGDMTTSNLALADNKILIANLNPETPTYVLIDPMLGEPLAIASDENITDAGLQSAREGIWQNPVFPIVLSPQIKLPPHKHPYLVAVGSIDAPMLSLTLEIAHAERIKSQSDGLDGDGAAVHRIGGWLQSTMRETELATQLSQMMRVNTEAATKATYLRLLDRRTLALMRHVVGDAGICKQFGRLQRWVYLDVQGRITSLDSLGETMTPLRLDLTQWRDIQAGEMLNRTLAQWLGEARRQGQTNLDDRAAQTLFAPVMKALERARQAARLWPHRFPAALDQSIWAALTLLHPTFDNIPTVIALMQNTGDEGNPPEPLQYLLEQINEYVSDTRELAITSVK